MRYWSPSCRSTHKAKCFRYCWSSVCNWQRSRCCCICCVAGCAISHCHKAAPHSREPWKKCHDCRSSRNGTTRPCGARRCRTATRAARTRLATTVRSTVTAHACRGRTCQRVRADSDTTALVVACRSGSVRCRRRVGTFASRTGNFCDIVDKRPRIAEAVAVGDRHVRNIDTVMTTIVAADVRESAESGESGEVAEHPTRNRLLAGILVLLVLY